MTMEKEIERYFNKFFHLNGGERMKFEDIDWNCVYVMFSIKTILL